MCMNIVRASLEVEIWLDTRVYPRAKWMSGGVLFGSGVIVSWLDTFMICSMNSALAKRVSPQCHAPI